MARGHGFAGGTGEEADRETEVAERGAKIAQLTAERDFSAGPDGKPDRASGNNGQEL
jgi:hypothetical protein